MNLRTLILTKNNCYKAGKKIIPKGIVVHSTGSKNPNLKRYVGPDDGLLGINQNNNHWNQPTPGGRQVCVHGFIGKLADGTIATYQTLPWDMRAWHGGSGKNGSVNDLYIGFEICEDDLTDNIYFEKVYKEAVELCAMLCGKYGIKPESPTLICHSEAYTLGLASNHSDVMHWFPKHGKSMDTFRADVKKLLDSVVTAPIMTTATETPTATTTSSAFTPYVVKVDIDDLSIRTGPGTNNVRTGYTGKGSFTIVEEATGTGATKWGLLKAYQAKRNGWISLDYAKKV